jgi:hypothetical protein
MYVKLRGTPPVQKSSNLALKANYATASVSHFLWLTNTVSGGWIDETGCNDDEVSLCFVCEWL